MLLAVSAALEAKGFPHRWPLMLGADRVGSVHPQWLQALERSGVQAPWVEQKTEQHHHYLYAEEPFLIENSGSFALAVHQAGLSGPWRHEAVPVLRDGGQVWACVERAMVRVLGLRTQAVHLVGLTPDGHCWVQQRSLQKPNDPGMWDTLMGGTVSGNEVLADTLERETWEEAGLHVGSLHDVRHAGCFTARRTTPDGGGFGLLVEETHWFVATVPDGLEPVNQDGEVDHFECWSPTQVQQAVAQGLFTPEAAWVLGQAL